LKFTAFHAAQRFITVPAESYMESCPKPVSYPHLKALFVRSSPFFVVSIFRGIMKMCDVSCSNDLITPAQFALVRRFS